MNAAVVILGTLLIVAVASGLWNAARSRSSRSALEREHEQKIETLEQRSGEAEARSSALTAALEGTHLGIIVADNRGTVLLANPAAEQILAGRLGDAVVRGRVLQLVDRVTQFGQVEELEFDLYTPVRRVVRLRAIPFGDESRGAIVYIRDLTDQHLVDVMRQDFVTNAGHELKTPLGALSVLAELTPELKRCLLTACAEYISADHEITIAEAELFRAIADTVGCPVPPLLPGQPLV